MTDRSIDYSPLTAPLSPGEVEAWRVAAKASGAPWARVSRVVSQRIGVTLLLGCTFMFVFPLVCLVAAVHPGPDDYGPVFRPEWFILGTVGLFGTGAGVLIWIIRVVRREHRHWARWVRMADFARRNGFNFSPSPSNPNYPGAIFLTGDVGSVQDDFDTTSGRFLDIGNFASTVYERYGPKTTTWGFLALSLDRVLPQMLLISHSEHGVLDDHLPVTPVPSQAVHLEGDFDKHFTLYCPPDYQTDALYVFTPDLMALLIDELGVLDAEIVDRWMFVYSSTPFDMTNPAVLQRLFRIADTVGAKTLSQTDRYNDAHAGAATGTTPTGLPATTAAAAAAAAAAAKSTSATNIVVPEGARLKTRLPLRLRVSIIVVVAMVIFVLVGLIGGAVGASGFN